MNRQLSLEDIQTEAIARAGRHADPAWKEGAFELVLRVARANRFFTVDDVWDIGLPETRENRALGAVMKQVQKRGYISPTDRVENSRRHSHNHGRRITVWESLIYAYRDMEQPGELLSVCCGAQEHEYAEDFCSACNEATEFEYIQRGL
tara:strand:- start:7379 stop:7825 length:447 start_codon:yes stop_codon:yes gene_type:complete